LAEAFDFGQSEGVSVDYGLEFGTAALIVVHSVAKQVDLLVSQCQRIAAQRALEGVDGG
jgi:hypothetical protein